MNNIKIILGNALDTLKKIPSESINTCITSPPYWGLRDYGTAEWVGGDPNCPHMRTTKISKDTSTGHKAMFEQGNVVGDAIYKNECPKCGAIRKDKQLGLEDTPEEFVNNLVEVFREVKRVLRDDGTVWLNLGDSYSSGGRTTTVNQTLRGVKDYGVQRPKTNSNIKPKDLIGIPWRVAFALQEDGWYLRQDIIWHKPNPMPESVTDRCTKAHEYIFLLSKSPKYYFDNEAIKDDAKFPDGPTAAHAIQKGVGDPKMLTRNGLHKIGAIPKSNKRSVWTITTKPFTEAHFATFPKDLIEPCVLAGCPEKVCVDCNTPYVRQVESKRIKRNELPKDDSRYRPNIYEGSYKEINGKADAGYTETKDLGLQKQCDCKTNETKSGTVLDPFGGSGTTGVVAVAHNRDAILCELNKDYVNIMEKRLDRELGMFHTKEILEL